MKVVNRNGTWLIVFVACCAWTVHRRWQCADGGRHTVHRIVEISNLRISLLHFQKKKKKHCHSIDRSNVWHFAYEKKITIRHTQGERVRVASLKITRIKIVLTQTFFCLAHTSATFSHRLHTWIVRCQFHMKCVAFVSIWVDYRCENIFSFLPDLVMSSDSLSMFEISTVCARYHCTTTRSHCAQ